MSCGSWSRKKSAQLSDWTGPYHIHISEWIFFLSEHTPHMYLSISHQSVGQALFYVLKIQRWVKQTKACPLGAQFLVGRHETQYTDKYIFYYGIDADKGKGETFSKIASHLNKGGANLDKTVTLFLIRWQISWNLDEVREGGLWVFGEELWGQEWLVPNPWDANKIGRFKEDRWCWLQHRQPDGNGVDREATVFYQKW